MNSIKQLTIVGGVMVLAISIGGIGWMWQLSNAELTDQEVYNLIQAWHDNNGAEFASQNELVNTMAHLENVIAEPHIEFDSIAKTTSNLRQDVNELRIEVAKLKIQQSGTGTSSQGSISATVEDNCYKIGDLVQIDGMATPSRQLTSSIYKTGFQSVFEATPTTQTSSNGSYTLFWVIPDNIDTGTYIVKLKDSGGKFGETTVSVRDNC